MKIRETDLRLLCEIILQLVEQLSKKVLMKVDFYWNINIEEACIINTPPEITVGSLKDDWEELRKILKGTHPITLLDFERMGNLVKALGHSPSTNLEEENCEMLVSVAEVKTLCSKMLNKATKCGFDEIKIELDLYWDVNDEDIYDLTKDPKISICSLNEDWKILERLLCEKRSISSNEFRVLGIMLKLVGETISRSMPQLKWFITDN